MLTKKRRETEENEDTPKQFILQFKQRSAKSNSLNEYVHNIYKWVRNIQKFDWGLNFVMFSQFP